MSGGDNIIFSLPESQVLPITITIASITGDVDKDRVAIGKTLYKGLKILQRKRTYIVPETEDDDLEIAQEGALIKVFIIERITKRRIRRLASGWFMVVKCGEREVTLSNDSEGVKIVLKTENLVKLRDLDKKEVKQIHADMANRYKAHPSLFYPVELPYAVWVLGWRHLIPEIAPRIPSLTEEEKEKLLPEWLSKGYLVTFTLISEYRFAQSKYEVGPATVRETRIVPVEKVADFRNFRSRFYRFLKMKSIRTPMGWWLIDTSEATMNQLNELMNDYARIVHKYLGPNYPFKPIYIVEVYIPRKILVSFVRDYIVELKASIEAIEKKLEELKAEEEDKKVRRKIKRIVRNKEFLEEALKKAEEFMKKIETKAKVEVSGRLMALRMEL